MHVSGSQLSGQLQVMDWIPCMPKIELVIPHHEKHRVPDNLKPTFVPFGSGNHLLYAHLDRISHGGMVAVCPEHNLAIFRRSDLTCILPKGKVQCTKNCVSWSKVKVTLQGQML